MYADGKRTPFRRGVDHHPDDFRIYRIVKDIRDGEGPDVVYTREYVGVDAGLFRSASARTTRAVRAMTSNIATCCSQIGNLEWKHVDLSHGGSRAETTRLIATTTLDTRLPALASETRFSPNPPTQHYGVTSRVVGRCGQVR